MNSLRLVSGRLSLVCFIFSITMTSCSQVSFMRNRDGKASRLSTITTGVQNEPSAPSLESRFECKDLGNGRYRPYYLQAVDGAAELRDFSQIPKGLLGQNPMTSLEECSKALENANHKYGVICSRTGLNGWKPTLYTGTVPGRADFGYLGGSSITKFEDCLKSTAASSEKGVCYWGGSAWYAGRIDREGNSLAGPFSSVDSCIEATKVQ